jgi:hypothetical protein
MRRVIATLLIASQWACLGPTRHYTDPGDALYAESSANVTVNLRNGTSVQLTGAQVVLDSLITGWTNEGRDFVGYPLTDVQSVSARERSASRTAILVGGIVAVAVGAAMLGGGAGPAPVLPGEEGEEEEL